MTISNTSEIGNTSKRTSKDKSREAEAVEKRPLPQEKERRYKIMTRNKAINEIIWLQIDRSIALKNSNMTQAENIDKKIKQLLIFVETTK